VKKYTVTINRLLLCSLTLLLFSCGGKTDMSSEKRQDIAILSCVVLLPTEIARDESVIDPVQKEKLVQGADFLDKTLRNKLDQSQVAKVIDPMELMPQFNEISGGMSGVIREIGDKTQCNTVLLTNLRKFTQRLGGEYASDTPASAAFQFRLVEADTGKTLWNAAFNETQTSLLSNLFAFGKAQNRGFKWITVEELVAQGVDEKLQGCPYLY
jgi:hypothetical protein